jgi:hypothetical protein
MSETVVVPNRKITADSIVREWPGALVLCVVNKVDDSTSVTFHDGSPVPIKTERELIDAQDEYDSAKVADKYKDDRRKDYGDIGDQLDMQYWDSVNDTTVWADHIATVKAAHPKPEG